MDRRSFLRVVGGTAALSLAPTRLGSRVVRGQEATNLTGLGLPELTVTLTDEGYRVSPATTPAGWTLVTFDNQTSERDNSANIMALPPGETVESIHEGIATATAGGPVPAWAFQATDAGAPWAPVGATAQAVVLLTAGDWVVFNGGAPLPPVSLTVTGGDSAPATPPGLTADLDVTLLEMAFVGLEGAIPTGQQIWKVTNTGHQPHLMTLHRLPDGTTRGRFLDSVTAMMTGTPVPDAIAPNSMLNVGGCATLSRGRTLYLALDLPAGTYGAICFFPDQQTGMPHVMMGMAQVFAVG